MSLSGLSVDRKPHLHESYPTRDETLIYATREQTFLINKSSPSKSYQPRLKARIISLKVIHTINIEKVRFENEIAKADIG